MKDIRSFVVFFLTCFVAVVAVGAVVTAAMSYEPPNPKADGPQASPTAVHQAASAFEMAAGFTEGCARAGRDPVAGVLDGVMVLRCPLLPSLGVGPAVTRNPASQPQVAIRNLQGREAEDLVGPPTPTRPVRTGAPSGSPGRAGSDTPGGRP